MQCLRCGRETEDEHVFCFLCEAVMMKHPVKPNTVVNIPDPNARARSTQPRRQQRQEDESEKLRRTIMQLRLWVCMLMAALMLCVGVLTWQELNRDDGPAIGQNYHSILEQEPEGQ